MAKIQRITSEANQCMRVKSDMTYNDLRTAVAFHPDCLLRKDKEGKVLYRFELDNATINKFGNHGANLVTKESDEKISFIKETDRDETQFIAAAAKIQHEFTELETRVQAALKQFNKAKENIEEV